MEFEQNIREFKEKLITEDRQGLVLDIDETLAWTVRAWVEELQKEFGNPDGLTPEEIIEKYRFTQHVPYWQTPDAAAWMQQARENDPLHEVLPLIEQANHIVKQIDQIVPIVGYLSIRSESVRNGTQKWLDRHGFPRADLVLRPDSVPYTQGPQWKANALHYLYPQVVGIVDDNPSLLTHLPTEYPGTVYLFDSAEAMVEGSRIIPCRTWNDVHAQVKIFHGVETAHE